MNINDSFWLRCGVITIDHVAVTTGDLYAVLRDYLGLPGSELIRGPGVNTSQNVDFAFVRTASGMMVEILGVKEDSPITEHVEKGGGAYHLCFSVNNLDQAVQSARDNGAIQVVESREDDAFDGRRVSFLVHPDHGLFEFLESYPEKFQVKAQAISAPPVREDHSNDDAKEIIKNIISKMFPELKSDTQIESAEYDVTPGWGSFKHLQLFMEIEQAANVSFTADEIAEILSFDALVDNLKRKLEK